MQSPFVNPAAREWTSRAPRGTARDFHRQLPGYVGSLAQAVVTHYRRAAVAETRVLSVEPDTAAGILTSLRADAPTPVTTGNTIAAGLNCGTVSAAAWPAPRAGLDAAIAVSDDETRSAMAALARQSISSGACGAAPLAGLTAYLNHPGARDAIGLPNRAVVVLISTEGAAG
ncbi:MAG: pyridoxal-phosphate dependent enzyme [Tetrasphaera sp.]